MAPASAGAIVAPPIYQRKRQSMLPVPISVEDEQLTPTYAHSTDAGADLRASHGGVIFAGERELVSTGVKLDIPAGYVGLIHPRSGLAAKKGVTVLNTPGTIDAGYQGEIKVILLNTSDEDFVYNKYDRIAQIVFQKVELALFVPEGFDTSSIRSIHGFGSTGVN